MTGRGRPQKAKSLDSAEEQRPKEQKKMDPSKRKLPALSPQEGTPPNTPPKASTQVTKPKTYTCRAPTKKQPADSIEMKRQEETTKKQTEEPRTTKKDSVKATKAKPGEKTTKSQQKSSEEMQPEALKDTKNDPKKDKTPKACVPPKAAVDRVLNKTLEKLKIKQQARSDASEVINKLVANIIAHLKTNTKSFEEVEEPLRTGSYYENLKISNPDEFDVMLPIPVQRVTVTPFGESGAFYSVALKREKSPLQKFQENDILSASKMLDEFRDEVKKCAKNFPEWKLTRKKKGCPAVTLTTQVNSVTISLDVVLSIIVKSQWPSFTSDGLQIEKWQGTKERQAYRRVPYYLVPKFEGKGTEENDGVLAKDVWRVSFSHVEKSLLRKHGSEKTCCEKGGVPCCRKPCLKLLKHLLSRLKEGDSSFDKFCSYHAKTTLLHACCSRAKDSDWKASDLSHCFQLLLEDFVAYLKKGHLQNFFIPSQNLLYGLSKKKCNDLARRIEEECNNGFPIFDD